MSYSEVSDFWPPKSHFISHPWVVVVPNLNKFPQSVPKITLLQEWDSQLWPSWAQRNKNGAKCYRYRLWQFVILYFQSYDFHLYNLSRGFKHSADAVKLEHWPTEDMLSPPDYFNPTSCPAQDFPICLPQPLPSDILLTKRRWHQHQPQESHLSTNLHHWLHMEIINSKEMLCLVWRLWHG